MLALKTVEQLVDENHGYAYVLDCYGIEFFKYSDKTIGELCDLHNLNIDHLCHNLEASLRNSVIAIDDLKQYPIELVIEYLKHAHYIFLKRSLPYMRKLVSCLDPRKSGFPHMIEDLQLVFPLFAEDFIHHIYEEEDELFKYISLLSKVESNKLHHNKIYHLMESISLDELADHHEDADDEMRGIRKLTRNYSLGIDADLHLRTIYRELMHFEKELVFHANVENDILFPKASELEQKVKLRIQSLKSLN